MAQGQGRAPGVPNKKALARGLGGGGGKPGDVKARDLEQSAFQAGLDFEIPAEVSAAVDQFLSGQATFEDDPARRAALFEAEVQAPAMQLFQDETIRGILQNAATSGRRGPAVAAELGDAATNLTTNLAALRAQFFRADEDRSILAQEAALGRVGAGAGARLNEAVLPIQLQASLGAQARGGENQARLQSFLQNFLQQSQSQSSALQGAILGGVPQPFRFDGDVPSQKRGIFGF